MLVAGIHETCCRAAGVAARFVTPFVLHADSGGNCENAAYHLKQFLLIFVYGVQLFRAEYPCQVAPRSRLQVCKRVYKIFRAGIRIAGLLFSIAYPFADKEGGQNIRR